MKKLSIVFSLVLVGILTSFVARDNASSNKNNNPRKYQIASGETYKANPQKSTIEWHGKKALVSGQHNGFVTLKTGTLIVDNNKITGGNFTIDMTSITNEDITDKENNAKLVGHLKSADFFEVEKYPKATLKIKQVKDNNVTADATIKGITKEISFPITEAIKGNELTATANITINRTQFGVEYGSKSFFSDLVDKYVIDDNITLAVKIIANK